MPPPAPLGGRFPNLAGPQQRWYGTHLTQLAEQLDKKLATWSPHVVAQVEQIVTDVIELADAQALDLIPSRTIVQEVLDALDESKVRGDLVNEGYHVASA